MSSSRSTDDPEEEHPYHHYSPYDEGVLIPMPPGQDLPHLDYGATWDSIPQHGDHYGAPQYHPQSYLLQHGGWDHEQNRHILPASRSLQRTLEHDDAAGSNAHLQSLSLDSNWNPDARNDPGSAARNAYDDKGQGIWGARPRQLPGRGRGHDYASSFQQHLDEATQGSHRHLPLEEALQSGDGEHREQHSRSQLNYAHPGSRFDSRTAPQTFDYERSQDPWERNHVYRPPSGRVLDDVYLPTTTEDKFDYYNHSPGPLTKTQEANQRHAATLLVKPSEMDFRHPPIRPLTDQARNDTIPNSHRNYVDNVPIGLNLDTSLPAPPRWL